MGVSVRRTMINVALEQLRETTLEQLFKATTPERLSAGGPWAPSTVRYQFGHRTRGDEKKQLAFQRRDLALGMLEVALEDSPGASGLADPSDEEVALPASARDPLGDVLAVVTSDVHDPVPGSTAAEVSARDRMYHLALTVADRDADAARLLRDARYRRACRHLRVYAAVMADLGRAMRPGRSVEDLADAVCALVDGQLSRCRFEPGSSNDWIEEAVVGLFMSFTVPVELSPSDPPPSPSRRRSAP